MQLQSKITFVEQGKAQHAGFCYHCGRPFYSGDRIVIGSIAAANHNLVAFHEDCWHGLR